MRKLPSLQLTDFLVIEIDRLNVDIEVDELALHAIAQMNALCLVGAHAHRESAKTRGNKKSKMIEIHVEGKVYLPQHIVVRMTMLNQMLKCRLHIQ